MTDQEVLEKAFEIAGENGYKLRFSERHAVKCLMSNKSYYNSIFTHEFAKAFWSFIETEMDGGVKFVMKPLSKEITGSDHNYWEKQLMNMVLEENPIDYLRKFVEDE